jgi:hypothetical protein
MLENFKMTAETRGRVLTLKQVARLPEFQQLSERQQIFVSRYLSGVAVTGRYDAGDAASVAYRVKPENAHVMGWEILGGKRVKKVIDLAFGRSPMDRLLEDLHVMIKRSLRRDARNGGLANADTTRAIEFYEKHSGKPLEC